MIKFLIGFACTFWLLYEVILQVLIRILLNWSSLTWFALVEIIIFINWCNAKIRIPYVRWLVYSSYIIRMLLNSTSSMRNSHLQKISNKFIIITHFCQNLWQSNICIVSFVLLGNFFKSTKTFLVLIIQKSSILGVDGNHEKEVLGYQLRRSKLIFVILTKLPLNCNFQELLR